MRGGAGLAASQSFSRQSAVEPYSVVPAAQPGQQPGQRSSGGRSPGSTVLSTPCGRHSSGGRTQPSGFVVQLAGFVPSSLR